MATDFLSTPSAATVAGLLVAGLGAAYAYTQLGTPKDTHTHAHTTGPSEDGDSHATNEAGYASGAARKGRKKRRGKGAGVDVGKDEGQGESKDKGEGGLAIVPQVIPGNFEGVGADAGTNVGPHEASPSGTVSKRGNGGKTRTKKNKNKKQGKGKDEDEDEEEGSETGKEVGVGVGVGRAATHRPHSSDSTDASVSLSPSVSASALASSRATRKGNLRAASTRLAPPSQPREIRPSLSFDTDSSWTHVDHSHLKSSRSTDGRTRGLADAMDVTSSDLASTASNSPVAERMDGVATDIRGARADLVERTLAEKPKQTTVDDILEEPDVPTVARVMPVQPPTDETPVPGFSWEDYGEVVEESVLVDDADQEDEGEWGVVKSRNRTRSSQMTTTTTSTSHVAAAPQSMTKKQRQNARKRELAKSAKTEVELSRLEGLARHKRELERLRIIEQSQQAGGKRPSGGMQATVDSQGKLVWE